MPPAHNQSPSCLPVVTALPFLPTGNAVGPLCNCSLSRLYFCQCFNYRDGLMQRVFVYSRLFACGIPCDSSVLLCIMVVYRPAFPVRYRIPVRSTVGSTWLVSDLVVLPVVSLPLVSLRVCFFCLCVYTRACTCARIFIARRAAVGSLGMRTPSLNSASGQTGVQWIARRFFSLTEPCGLEVFRVGACRHASSM